MRPWTILSCLLLVPPPSVLACYEYTAEATPTLSVPNRGSATWGAEAEEATMVGAWLAAAGSASMALIFVAFRAFSRARGRDGIGPVEFEPSIPAGPPEPPLRPSDAWIRVDPGHARPEPAGVGRGEEVLSGALEMH